MTSNRFRRVIRLAAPLLFAFATPVGAVTVPTSFLVENAVPGIAFNVPTSVTFLPDGRYFVAEKRGRIYFVDNGVRQSTVVLNIESEVLSSEDRGLLDVAVDPQYATNRFIYCLYTVDPDLDGDDSDVIGFGRLTRYRINSSNVADVSTRTILIGSTWTSGIPEGSNSHSIGTLRWGQDGSLLVSAGDGALFTETDAGGKYPGLFGSGKTDTYEDIGAFRAQSLSSLAGKILRINPADGTGYSSNPFWDGNATSKRSRIWCYGLRNPFRFNIRPGTGNSSTSAGDPGTLFIGDVGLDTWEEANVARTGGINFGWPCYEGRFSQTAYQSASPAHNGCGSFGTSDNPSQPTLPMMSWHHSNASQGSPSGYIGNASIGGAFYSGTQYPAAYHGRYFYADYGQNWIRVATIDGNDQLVSQQGFATNADAPVDLETDPITGNLFYISITSGEVRRIRYTGAGGNASPIAVAGATPQTGPVPLTVQFSSAGTIDPDGDALSYSWAFGDATGSTSTNPSHVYSTSGLFNAVLTVDDSKGGVARDTVVVYASLPGTFPSTPVLDNFNRANGALSAPWAGQLAGLQVTSNQLAQTGGAASTIWGSTTFGPTQEAYVTLSALTSGATEHDLMLKIQGLSWDTGHIEIRYDVDPRTVTVSTYAPGQGWVRRGGPYSVTLNPGDRLGGRAYGDGTVEVYRNASLIAGTTVSGWPFATNGGRIGITLAAATSSRVDDFGGGNATLNTNTPPVASYTLPANNSFFVAGDSIRMSGSATDQQDTPGNIDLRWEVDILHNNHTHPQIYAFDRGTAAIMGESHDDGTGAHYLFRFIATDTGNLSDSLTSEVWPEIDLRPASLQTTPSPPTDAATTQVSFVIQNLGRMLGSTSRWQLRMDGVSLATGDTLVPALGSVTISRTLGPFAGGPHTLRATVDTLGAVRETNESNNAIVLAINVSDGAPPLFLTGPTATPGATSATVAWTTNEAATGSVRYGKTTALGDSVVASSATSQSKTLPGLDRSTLYYYRVAATDAAGNTRLSAQATFTTLANRAPVASASGTPNFGAAPLTVQFSSAGSSDPDGDAITYAWAFGDGGVSTAANPSHLYSVAGSYVATLTVSDGFGGSGSAQAAINAGAAFPSTAVLDNFNRANGAIGGSWTGQTSGLSIGSNRLVQTTSGWNTVIWNGAAFGADQEAYVTIAALTASSPEHDLVLKVQGTSPTSAQLEVRYDDAVKQVKIATYSSTTGWVQQGTITRTFVAGDVLGARAYANGTLDVFRNGLVVGTVTIVNWAYATSGGRIGLTLGAATASALDDFGGGSIAAGPDLTPPAFTTGPSVTPATTSAQVAWTTSEPAKGSVRYGLTSALGDSVLTPSGPSGSATLPNLTRSTTYSWRVAATDAAGNTNLSGLSTFTTLANRPPVAVATATPSSGVAPLTVQLSSAGSSDPDGDPLSYGWTFGDGQTGSGASVSHTYPVPGSFTARLTVSDAFGGSASDSKIVTATTNAFPATAVLDDFNRANGAVGGSWIATSSVSIVSQQLAVTTAGYTTPIWNGAVYGVNQEAFITLATLAGGAPEHDVLLKVQGTVWSAGHIEVRYDDVVKKVYVSTYHPSQGWRTFLTLSPQTFVSGDVVGARAFSDGTVEVYRNGVEIGSTSITAWPFYNQGGRLGLNLLANGSRLDNFGGGTLPAGVTPAFGAGGGVASTEEPSHRTDGSISLSAATPNPARGAVSWALSLPRGTTLRWEILDLQGRSLWRESRDVPAGNTRLEWRAGRSVRPGVYLVAVHAEAATFTRRFVLIP